MRAGAAEAGLHFVRHANSPGRADRGEGLGKISRRQKNLPSTARRRFGEERGKLARIPGSFGHVGGVARARLGSAIGPAIDIRQRHDLHMRGLAAAALAVELVRADVHQRAGIAVVGGVQHKYAVAARMGAGQP